MLFDLWQGDVFLTAGRRTQHIGELGGNGQVNTSDKIGGVGRLREWSKECCVRPSGNVNFSMWLV